MASNHVSRITAGGLTNATIAPSIYGYCTTPATTVAKAVTMYSTGTTAGADWAAADLFHGLTIFVRFKYPNSAANPTLNVNNTGAKPIYRYNNVAPGTTAAESWKVESVVAFTYDTLLNTSGCWVMHDWLNDNDNTFPSIYVATGGSTATKIGTLTSASWASTTQPRVAFIDLYSDNTAAYPLTLNVNNHGAKPVYLNGEPSSPTNYTWPCGTYVGYFDGTNWYINTDGTIPVQTLPLGEIEEVSIGTTAAPNTKSTTKIWIEI